MGDPFLNYFALFVLIFVVVVLFYGIIAIHDVPHIIAKSRNHPHQDAIHAAGWVSLFTLHAIWPFLWIWAMAYKPERGWGFGSAGASGTEQPATLANEVAELRQRIAILEERTSKTQPDGKATPASRTQPDYEPSPDGKPTSKARLGEGTL